MAAGEVPLSLGTDTAGSIRQPAAFCGVVGVKPTYGRVSRYGLIAFASSLDCPGPVARTVKDAAAMLQVISGADIHDSTAATVAVPNYLEKLEKGVKGMYIGLSPDYFRIVFPDPKTGDFQEKTLPKETGPPKYNTSGNPSSPLISESRSATFESVCRLIINPIEPFLSWVTSRITERPNIRS